MSPKINDTKTNKTWGNKFILQFYHMCLIIYLFFRVYLYKYRDNIRGINDILMNF